eukprot:XP_001703160.1 predicted protein [Chlamydomonas reinhardtii]
MHQPAAEANAGGRRNHRGNKKQPRPALVTSVTAAAFKVLPLPDPGAHDAFMAEVSAHIRATNTGCGHICRVLGYRTGSMGPGGANLAQHPDQGLPTAALQVEEWGPPRVLLRGGGSLSHMAAAAAVPQIGSMRSGGADAVVDEGQAVDLAGTDGRVGLGKMVRSDAATHVG